MVADTLDSRLLLMHQMMVGDRARLDAYDRALAAAVRPDDVVVDAGAGTGILSLLALRHGARHVYAIEADAQMAALAQRVAWTNGLAERVTVIHGDARHASLPELADLLVAEMMGNLGPEEEMAEIVYAAARRLLRPGGRVVPERLVTRLQAVELADEGWGVWRDDVYGFTLRAVRDHAPSAAQLHFFSRPARLLSAPVDATVVRLGDHAAPPSGAHTLEIATAGTLHAVIGYFVATLAPGVTLSNFPSYPGCNWAVWLWPLRHTVVGPGDRVRVRLQLPPLAEVRTAAQWRLACELSRGKPTVT